MTTPNLADLRALTDTLAGPSHPTETYLQRVRRRNRAQTQAAEVLSEQPPTTDPDDSTGWTPVIPDLTDLL